MSIQFQNLIDVLKKAASIGTTNYFQRIQNTLQFKNIEPVALEFANQIEAINETSGSCID